MKSKYIDLTKFEKQKYPYSMVLGPRSNGKSYWIKRYCLTQAFRDPEHKFMYLRRYQIESRASDVEGYFRDAPITDITNGKYTKIVVYRGIIYFASIDPETGKNVRGAECGYIGYLSNEQHFKSQNYNDVQEIIYEEFISEGYLWREPERLQSLISTCARKRKIRVWLIGNTINRVCPYFSEYGLTGILTQKQGTVDVYEHHTDQVNEDGSPVIVRIGVYLTEQPSNDAKMFFGTMSKMTTGGKWQTREYPHMPYHYRECNKMYNVLLRHDQFLFNMEALKGPNGEYFIFVHPHTGKTDGYRIIDKDPDPSPLVTGDLDPKRFKGDRLMSTLISRNKVFFSDNLTGADYESIVRETGALA